MKRFVCVCARAPARVCHLLEVEENGGMLDLYREDVYREGETTAIIMCSVMCVGQAAGGEEVMVHRLVDALNHAVLSLNYKYRRCAPHHSLLFASVYSVYLSYWY